jgi:hypothetical protein
MGKIEKKLMKKLKFEIPPIKRNTWSQHQINFFIANFIFLSDKKWEKIKTTLMKKLKFEISSIK